MDNTYRKKLACFFILIIPFFSYFSCKVVMNRTDIAGNEKYELNWIKIKKYEKEATNGNRDAAYKLAMHYGRAMDNYQEYYYWLEVGAKNGDSRCLFLISSDLIYSNNVENIMNGYEGMLKAASHRNLNAIRFLNNTNSKLINYQDLGILIEINIVHQTKLKIAEESYNNFFGRIKIINNNTEIFAYNLNNIVLKTPSGNISDKVYIDSIASNLIEINPGESKQYPVYWTIKSLNELYRRKDLEIVIP